MFKELYQSRLLNWTICFCFMLITQISISQPSSDSLLRIAFDLRLQDPESAIKSLNSYEVDFMNRQDTLSAIKSLTFLATVYGHQAKYRESYDKLWKALSLANEANLDEQKILVYRRIGRYYSFYKRREKAISFFDQAHKLNKSLIERNILSEATLSYSYGVFSSTYRELGEPGLAQTYLDSSFLYYDKGKGGRILRDMKIEQAFIFTKKGKYQEAIDIINEQIPWVKERSPSYLVLIYSHLGDAYNGIENPLLAEEYYKKALEISERYNSHIDFSILIIEKLAALYAEQKNYQKAYEAQIKAEKLNVQFFDSRSQNNRPLLEIQDEFRKELENKEQYLKEQRLAQLEYESEVSFLQRTIILVLLISFILFGILYFYYLRNRHKVEKELAQEKRALEVQKNQQLLETKNKELAAFALKLVSKDELLLELKDKVTGKKENISLQEIKQLIKRATVNNTENWAEFEARFVAVNKNFYTNLRNRFPKLTPGDRRLCALIKLNFTSKEIARLMSISVESVHTTRYRLRRKLDLEKGVDLTDFIAQF